jgi:protein-L-isoaspartate(D-aspartate) O-methyltransferase
MDDLLKYRKRYAEEVSTKANLRSKNLTNAFAMVPREKFVGIGPWKILVPPSLKSRTTNNDDPIHLYQDVLVVIDEKRRLNNGQPSALAGWFDDLELTEGDSVLHIGCGVGYYTAILAEVVGPKGHIVALEIDPQLAYRAAENLANYPNIRVLNEDGCEYDTGPQDAIFVNAGVTHPLSLWLDNLKNMGRIIFPLTFDAGSGNMLKITLKNNEYEANFIGGVGIYHCSGARSEKMHQLLLHTRVKGGHSKVTTLRRDIHDISDSCWLHGDQFCLST